MTEPRKWLVRRSAWPFHALGAVLGTVVARNLETAHAVASCTYARPFTVEPYKGGPVVVESPAVAVARIARRKPRYTRQLKRASE